MTTDYAPYRQSQNRRYRHEDSKLQLAILLLLILALLSAGLSISSHLRPEAVQAKEKEPRADDTRTVASSSQVQGGLRVNLPGTSSEAESRVTI